jgi:ketosteroid isomerase-like protein
MNLRTSLVPLVIIIGAVGVFTGTAVSETQAPSLSKDAEALRAADLAWSDAANRKDLDAVVSYMADDGETLAPNEPVARGKDAVRAGWENILALPGLTIHWQPATVEVAKSGEMGYTSGTYTLSFTGADGKTVNDRGKYLEVWKKVGGTWKCAFDAYSSDLAAS